MCQKFTTGGVKYFNQIFRQKCLNSNQSAVQQLGVVLVCSSAYAHWDQSLFEVSFKTANSFLLIEVFHLKNHYLIRDTVDSDFLFALS